MQVHLDAHTDIGDRAAGATSRAQSSKVAGMPTASMAVSTPRSSVNFMTEATALPSPLLTVDVAHRSV